MHSSRMRTIRNSSRLLGGSAPGGACSQGGLVSSRDGCLLLGEVSALGVGGGGACSWGGIPACTEADPPVGRQTGVKI